MLVTWVVSTELQFWVCFSVCDVGSERRAAVQGVFQYLTWLVSGELQFRVGFSI